MGKYIHNDDNFIKTKIFSRGMLFSESRACGLESHGGKIKFEFLLLKIQISFSRHTYSSPKGRLS